MRAIHIHLSTAQGLPESVDASTSHTLIGNGVDQLRCKREPFLQIFDPEEGE